MAGPAPAVPKPRLRGVLHEIALYVTVPLGVGFGLLAAGMFGASALYHRFTWSPATRLWLRRLDHAGIFGLIAGTYTPFGLLVLHGAWQIVVLSIVWGGASVAILAKLAWVAAPKWLSVAVGIALGWVAVVAFPQILDHAGVAAATLVALGGACYTAGGVIYARRRPDPLPHVFGYHELFHALVIAAVGLQYVAVGLVTSG
jgi:hemolysin III